MEKSNFKVTPINKTADAASGPLITFDYIRSPRSRDVPTAHLNLDSHNPAFLPALAHAGASRRVNNRRNKAQKRTDKASEYWNEHGAESDVHVPLGGARFRPCLEDVLEMLINEFGIDRAQEDWRKALAEGRRRWRDYQLLAAVKDNPTTAVQQLRELGYRVEWAGADAPPPQPNTTKLERF